MDWIELGLAIGDLEDAMAHDLLREQGIRSVLTVSDFPNLSFADFVWRSVPLIDGAGNSMDQLAEAVGHLAELHAESPGVLVHCAEGKSRSVVIATLYLAASKGWTLTEAFTHVKTRRAVADPDDNLWRLGERFHAQRATGHGPSNSK